MMGKTDLLVLIGLILSLILFLTFATQNTSQQNQTILENQRLIKLALNASQQNSELILQNQQAIKAALNTTVSNSESLNRTQQAILHVNDNLLTVYTKLLNLTNAIDVNSHSNRAMTVQNREMLNFLRASFDDEFMAELLQDRKMKQDSLDLILTRLANISAALSPPSR
jgi:hypothetical protein